MNRQRKLTWIEKRHIEKVAFDHPFFEMNGKVLSKKEAKAIIRSAETRKSGTEIVTEACDKAGVPHPNFVDSRSSIFDNLKEVIAIPAIRRIGIIAIALILLVVFFAATPIGRAIAESVIKYIATLFDDGILAINQVGNESLPREVDYDGFTSDELQNPTNDTTICMYVDSFEEFSNATGKTPFVLPLPYTELYYIYDEEIDYLDMNAMYETPEGRIVTYQIWDADALISTTLVGYTMYSEDSSVYYSIEDNGDIVIKKVLADSYLGIQVQGNYELDNLMKMLVEN